MLSAGIQKGENPPRNSFWEIAILLYCFRSFDFKDNQQWQNYKLNLEFPAGADEEKLLQRVQAKWYQREIVSFS